MYRQRPPAGIIGSVSFAAVAARYRAVARDQDIDQHRGYLDQRVRQVARGRGVSGGTPPSGVRPALRSPVERSHDMQRDTAVADQDDVEPLPQ